MAENYLDIRGVLIPITRGRVLLPNTTVAEVITYKSPQPIEDAPDWVLGSLSWRGWRIPMFSYARLAGLVEEEDTSGAKLAVIKALKGNAHMPFMAMLAQGFPRLTTVTPDALVTDDAKDLPEGVSFRVHIDEQEAYVPALDELEGVLVEQIGRQA